MDIRFRQRLEDIDGSFWLRPGLLVICGIMLAETMIYMERWDSEIPLFILRWLYTGGETGARTLLGAIASSTIGVASTVFSITIATLTLASSQMGPRLLRNFTQDRGNQITLGIYLATFAYALIVLRSVRGVGQGAFVPHLAITGAILLAMLCVVMLIYFVNHVASRINFDTVIDLVYQDLHQRLRVLTAEPERHERLAEDHWSRAQVISHEGGGYIQQLDETWIADWAHIHGVTVRLNARVGDFVFPGAPLALVVPTNREAEEAIGKALVIGPYPTPSGDLEFAVEQLVDIAVRALSSGINDPRTANRILDRLGSSLCVIASRHLPSGAITRGSRVVFQRDITTYDGLMDTMFHTIRQSAKGSPTVLIHILDVLSKVALCEHDPDRRKALERHGQLIVLDGRRDIAAASDLESLEHRMELLAANLSAPTRM